MASADRWNNGRLTVGLLVTRLKKKKKHSRVYTLDEVGYLEDLVRRIVDFGHEPTVVRESVIG